MSLGRFFALSYREALLAFVSIAAVAAAGLLLAPDAFAQLTVGSGGTCTTSSKCALGSPLNTPFDSNKKKFCSCPQINVGYCTTCSQACSSSCLGGSTYALYSGGLLPIDTDKGTASDDGIDEDPNPLFLTGTSPFIYDITSGPSFRLKCTQGAVACPLGVPVVQSTQEVTFSRPGPKIFLSAAIPGLPAAATPDAPFKIQVASGTSRNDGMYTVVGVNGLELSVLERPFNETATVTVALANIKLTFTDALGDENKAKVYVRHLGDPVAGQEPQCVVVGGMCEDGVATAIGSFNAQVKCANAGTTLKLPCEVQGFAGKSQLALNSQEAAFTFPVGEHNFIACGGGTAECAIHWSDPEKVNNATCKKLLPETSDFALCQTLKFTITAGQSISDFLQRAINSTMAPASEPVSFAFLTSTNAPAGVSVNITAGPDPIQTGNPGSNGVLTVSILNNPAVNLLNVDVTSVALTFTLYGGAGVQTAIVQNDRAPDSCGTDCRNFKFDKSTFLDAYLSVFTPPGCSIPDNFPVPVHLVGAFTGGGEIFGDTVVHTNGVYTNPAACPI